MKLLFSLEQSSRIFPSLRQKLSQSSQYGKRLIESRKIRSFYGKLPQKYLQSLCFSSFFRRLESRLDVILYRAAFFESIAAAKQQIRDGKVQINNVKVRIPSYTLLPGDIISVLPQKYKIKEMDKISKKKGGWRFRRSPSFVSLISNIYPFLIKQNALKAIHNFQGIWLPDSFYTRVKVADEKALYKSPNGNKVRDWLFSFFIIFLKKQSSCFASPTIVTHNEIKEKRNKGDTFRQGRRDALAFRKAKDERSFYEIKKQGFLIDKRTKPLHLEISYKSLSIIFLFPPQRICFPFFINLSQIYK